LCLFYWFFDFYSIVFLSGRPSWLLWYSSSGLLLTSIALITGNVKLIYTAFCALFIIDFFWTFDFLFKLFSHHSLFGFTNYAFDAAFSKKDFFMSMYHMLVPFALIIAIFRLKTSYKYGWLGALFFTLILIIASTILTNPDDRVNCVHAVEACKKAAPFLFSLNNPFRTIFTLSFITLFVFMPSNYFLTYITTKHSRQYSRNTTEELYLTK
jgi:hypothetical protein